MLNLYNVQNKNLYMTFNTNYKNVTAFANVNSNDMGFLAGYQDGSVKYYDARDKNKALLQFRDAKAYCGYVSDICVSEDKENYPNVFYTACYDGKIRAYDIRGGSKALFAVETKDTEKNYTVKSNGNNSILCGGDGSVVNVFDV